MFGEDPTFNDAWWVILVVIVVIVMLASDNFVKRKVKSWFKRSPK